MHQFHKSFTINIVAHFRLALHVVPFLGKRYSLQTVRAEPPTRAVRRSRQPPAPGSAPFTLSSRSHGPRASGSRRACALPPRQSYVPRLGAAMAAGRGRASAPPRQGGTVCAGTAPDRWRVSDAKLTVPCAPERGQSLLLGSGRRSLCASAVSEWNGSRSAPRAPIGCGARPPPVRRSHWSSGAEGWGRAGATTTKGGGRPAAVTASPGASLRSRAPAPACPAPDEV